MLYHVLPSLPVVSERIVTFVPCRIFATMPLEVVADCLTLITDSRTVPELGGAAVLLPVVPDETVELLLSEGFVLERQSECT